MKQKQLFSFIIIMCLVSLNSHTILSVANKKNTLIYGITQFDYLSVNNQIVMNETTIKYEEVTIEEIVVSPIQSNTPMDHNIYVNFNVNSTNKSMKKSWYDS